MLIGIIIVIIGVCCLLENFGINVDWGMLVSLLLIFSSIFLTIKNKKVDFLSILLFIVGIWNLLLNLKLVTLKLGEILWPLLIIIAGLSIIFSKLKFNNKDTAKKISKDKKLIYNGIFSGVNEKVVDENIELIVINAIFGGVELDLRNIKLKQDLKIEICSIFGGVDLFLSDDYNVVVSSTSIFGGVENNHDNKNDKVKKTINVISTNIFGGTDLK